MKKQILSYTVIFQHEPEGGYTVTVPNLPGLVSYGKNLDEAKLMAKEAIEVYIHDMDEEEIAESIVFEQPLVTTLEVLHG